MTEKANNLKNTLQEIKKEIRRRLKRLRTAHVEVYYHPKQGYFIISGAVQKDSVAWLSIPPVETAAADADAGLLGAKIRKGLHRSKKAGFVDREDVEDFKFWQMTGVKGINSFKSFSKQFQCVNFFKKGKTLEIKAMVRDSYGAYAVPKEEDCRIMLSSSASAEAMGQAVLKLLQPERVPAEK